MHRLLLAASWVANVVNLFNDKIALFSEGNYVVNSTSIPFPDRQIMVIFLHVAETVLIKPSERLSVALSVSIVVQQVTSRRSFTRDQNPKRVEKKLVTAELHVVEDAVIYRRLSNSTLSLDLRELYRLTNSAVFDLRRVEICHFPSAKPILPATWCSEPLRPPVRDLVVDNAAALGRQYCRWPPILNCMRLGRQCARVTGRWGVQSHVSRRHRRVPIVSVTSHSSAIRFVLTSGTILLTVTTCSKREPHVIRATADALKLVE